MRPFSVYLVLTGCAVSLVGCGQSNTPATASARGGLAVVDLDKVAEQTGRDRQLAQSLELAHSSLNQAFTKKVESAREQLDAKKKSIGSAPSEEEQKEFVLMQRSAETQLKQIQTKAQAEYEQYRQIQIAKFRAELKPITQEVAAKRGLSIVIPKNEGLLLSVDPGVDITEDVVKILRERHPVVTPPAQPTAAVPEAGTPNTGRNSAAKSAGNNRTAAADEADEEDAVR